ncbi:UvrD-helicase domain-containing protein [Bradyrhizobium sp. SZCCHNPS1003]|uniref:UvrD-helicase domain-containing protein n=1 Tax=Bradyrhizobium sp. SZCCHNPS1003 TaxID=3057330 RepID=UPI0028E1C3FF|nr:UvrD-helicase domain-containing protein [Bradyrhizobium sp. SZCCHNPS1003]
MLKSFHVNDVIAASYSHHDEYQDCSLRQHAIIYHAAVVLPTCGVGDQVQAIFDFSASEIRELAGKRKMLADMFVPIGKFVVASGEVIGSDVEL